MNGDIPAGLPILHLRSQNTKMNKKKIEDLKVENKTVFVRNDFNVPLNKDGSINDDSRIKASIPTLKYLLDNGAKIVCSSHLGRPGGEKKIEFSLEPVAKRLSELLDRDIIFTGDTIGEEVEREKQELKKGSIFLLENLRFDKGERENSSSFAKELAKNIDIYVNDAFGASHRSHASISAITKFVPVSSAGMLLEKEIGNLSLALIDPPKGYTVILGGAKVKDKIPVIKNLMEKADNFLIGGAMSYTFLKALGNEVGNSIIDRSSLQICKEILDEVPEKNIRFVLPTDHIAALTAEPNITIRIVKEGEDIPEDMKGLDIGFETLEIYKKIILESKLILWNGPMGVFEIDTFSGGTFGIAEAVAKSDGISIAGGGDTISAINLAGVADKITYISTGGGASLDFLAGKKLPGIESLSEE